MMVGNIVYFDELRFKDGKIDNKKNRPCVVVSKIEREGESFLLCVPVTSSFKSFNNYNYKYTLIPEPIYNYHKMCFAKLDNLFMMKESLAYDTSIMLGNISMNIIVRKLYYYPDESVIYNLFRESVSFKTYSKNEKKKVKRI